MLRRHAPRSFLSAALVACLALPGCGGVTDEGRAPRPKLAAPDEPAPPPPPAASPARSIGSGPVKIALVLPLGAPGQAADAALSLRNAAELALADAGGTDAVTILVRDDRGSADGAMEATRAALADGAEIVLGPLFAPAVAAAGTVARGANRPVVAFSTDAGVASRGVYLLSFMPGDEVDRILDHAAAQGRRSVAALLPDTAYGSVVEAAFQEGAARRGIRVAALERFPAGQPAAAVGRLAAVIAGASPSADALLLPISGAEMPAVGAALAAIRFDPARVKPLGTGLWSDARAAGIPALRGGAFAGPDPAGFKAFAARYRARFGSEPARIATLGYDATSLAAALARQPAASRFTDATLQSRAGFTGADGPFRFRPDGTGERALAVYELGPEGATVVSPAPRGFGRSAT